METRAHFHAELGQLRGRVLDMAGLVTQAVEDGVRAYQTRDLEAARQVIAKDQEINRNECDIHEECLKLLALEQPVALDLRQIVGTMRIVLDLERLGDEALSISEGALAANGKSAAASASLEELSVHARRMYEMAITALRHDDLALAYEVCRLDERANELAVESMRETTDLLSRGEVSPAWAVRGILVVRSLERIGDHAANIAESLIFIFKGTTPAPHCQPV